jgi:hypothetical protein
MAIELLAKTGRSMIVHQLDEMRPTTGWFHFPQRLWTRFVKFSERRD